MDKSVLCVGVAVQDHIFRLDRIPDAAIKVFASDYVSTGGGPAATGAATVARLGGQAALWGRIGEDDTGADIIGELRGLGVDVVHLRQIPGRRSNVSSVIIDKTGERLIIAYADDLERDSAWLPLERITDYNAVLCDSRWPEASALVLRAARERGIPTVLDADLTPDNAVAQLYPLADHAVFSQPALAALTGTDDPGEGLRRAGSNAPGTLSVTLGGAGFAWIDPQGVLQRQPGFPVEVVDTLGAGDVFHGAFALAIASGLSTAEAGRFAGATAALKCTRWGGRRGIPDLGEVEALLKQPN